MHSPKSLSCRCTISFHTDFSFGTPQLILNVMLHMTCRNGYGLTDGALSSVSIFITTFELPIHTVKLDRLQAAFNGWSNFILPAINSNIYLDATRWWSWLNRAVFVRYWDCSCALLIWKDYGFKMWWVWSRRCVMDRDRSTELCL